MITYTFETPYALWPENLKSKITLSLAKQVIQSNFDQDLRDGLDASIKTKISIYHCPIIRDENVCETHITCAFKLSDEELDIIKKLIVHNYKNGWGAKLATIIFNNRKSTLAPPYRLYLHYTAEDYPLLPEWNITLKNIRVGNNDITTKKNPTKQ